MSNSKKKRFRRTNKQIEADQASELEAQIKERGPHMSKPRSLTGRNDNQKLLFKAIKGNEIVISYGPAGTGKSIIQVCEALHMLYENKIEKIMFIKPIVPVSKNSIGFLPGEKEDKMAPYIYSACDLIDEVMGDGIGMALIEDGRIEFQALQYIRGNNIRKTAVILDEAQNTDQLEMLTLLTRLGEGSRIMINGDLRQCDKFNDSGSSGLAVAVKVLEHLDECEIIEFTVEDVVRSPLVKKILIAWDKYYD